jgi:hypothetical protein
MKEYKVGDKVRIIGYKESGTMLGHYDLKCNIHNTVQTITKVVTNTVHPYVEVKPNGIICSFLLCDIELVQLAHPTQPRAHAEIIKAWADGAQIEYKDDTGDWMSIELPSWHSHFEYRIMLAVKYHNVETTIHHSNCKPASLKYYYENGVLVKVDIL